MGIFDSRDIERTLEQLQQIFGANDRVTGMIPDTYDDPSETSSYGSMVWDRVPQGVSKIVRPFKVKHQGRLSDPRNKQNIVKDGHTSDFELRPYVEQDAEGTWHFNESPYGVHMAEDGTLRSGLDDPTAPNYMSIGDMTADAADAASNMSVSELAQRGFNEWKQRSLEDEARVRRNRNNFLRGISLADDAESFIDRQTYRDDGTVGSEERARGYKAEGARELLRGIGYGAVNVPDAVLGIGLDEDNILRAPTQMLKRGLAYEETGDKDADSALSAMHSLGEGIGETVATGGVSGLANLGVRTAAHFAPRQIMFRMSDSIPYSLRSKMAQLPHVETMLNTHGGSELLNTVTEGAVDLAMLNQIAKEENWGTEDFETLAGLTVGANILGKYRSLKPEPKNWKALNTEVAPYRLGEAIREVAIKPTKKRGKLSKPINKNGKKIWMVYDKLHESVNPHVPHMMTYNGELKRDREFKHPLFVLPEQYKDPVNDHLLPKSPRPHQIMYTRGKSDKLRVSDPTWAAILRDRGKEIPDIHNEEIRVYPDNVFRNKASGKKELSPNNDLILKNELQRVFGKHAYLEKGKENTFHITLPNGIELNAQTVDTLTADPIQAAGIRRKYDLPIRTRFDLKGSLTNVDTFDLIRLSNLHDVDTLQHEAVHFAMNTVTTKKEKETLRKMFGNSEEEQIAGVMDAIRQERLSHQQHPNAFVNKLLRKVERFGGYIKSFTENVPTAIAKRDLSYLEGRSPQEILRDYAESFVDGSVWGRELAPVTKEFVQEHRDAIAETLRKNHSMRYPEKERIVLAQRSPNIFSILPYDNNPLQIDDSIIEKVLNEKHNDSILPEHLARLPQELEQPILIIRSTWDRENEFEKYKDTYNFLLDMVDKNHANILVPVGFNYDQKRGHVNKIKSMYGFTEKKDIIKNKPDIDKIHSMMKNKELVYVDREKLLELFRRYRPSSYYEVRDYLYGELPDHVFTKESYREFRKRRGMKPELDMQDNYFDPINN